MRGKKEKGAFVLFTQSHTPSLTYCLLFSCPTDIKAQPALGTQVRAQVDHPLVGWPSDDPQRRSTSFCHQRGSDDQSWRPSTQSPKQNNKKRARRMQTRDSPPHLTHPLPRYRWAAFKTSRGESGGSNYFPRVARNIQMTTGTHFARNSCSHWVILLLGLLTKRTEFFVRGINCLLVIWMIVCLFLSLVFTTFIYLFILLSVFGYL